MIIDFNNHDETETNFNIFLSEHDIVDVEEMDRSDHNIRYRIRYIIPSIPETKNKNKDLNKKINNGEKVNYYSENDYLAKLSAIDGAYYRYAKDIRNLIAIPGFLL